MPSPLMLADLDIPAIIGTMTGFFMVGVVPLVWVFLNHQRKMTQMIHGDAAANRALAERVAGIEREIEELRARLNEHVLDVDNLKQLGQGS